MKVRTTIEVTDEERVALGGGDKVTGEKVSEFITELWESARVPLVRRYLQNRLEDMDAVAKNSGESC